MKKIYLTIFLTAAIQCSLTAQVLQWAKKTGGTGFEASNAIVLDATGNIYTTGYFFGTVDFDPGAGTFNLTAVGSSADAFISKVDAAGNFVWAKQLGGTGFDYGNAIFVDATGNVLTAGMFVGTADFDPGAGNFNLVSAGLDDMFISKLDAAGNFVWAKSIGGSQSDKVNGITVDASGNVYTTGGFQTTVDFDPGAGTFNLTAPNGFEDIFISKLNAAGNFVWAKAAGSNSLDYAEDITVDAAGNVLTTGNFSGTVDFDPGPATFNLTAINSRDIFVYKLDATGNFIWAKQYSSTSSFMIGKGVCADASGNIYTTGSFSNTVDFNPAAATFNLTAAGEKDCYVTKLDASGNFIWAKQIGGTDEDNGAGITTDVAGNIYTTGIFTSTANFNAAAGNLNITASGNSDCFITKMNTAGNLIWANTFGGVEDDEATGIVSTTTGVLHVTGNFSGTSDFDPSAAVLNLTSAGQNDFFVLKLNQPTNSPTVTITQAATQPDPTAANIINFTVVFSEAVTGFTTGDVIISGEASPTTAIVTGSGTTYNVAVSGMTTAGSVIANVLAGVAINGASNSNYAATSIDNTVDYEQASPVTLQWAKSFGSPTNDLVTSNCTDAFGNVYTTGIYAGTIDFDPGVGVFNLSSGSCFSTFISKLDAAGNFVWAKQFSSFSGFCTGASPLSIESITTDAAGNIYTTGSFSDTVDFDPGPGVVNLIAPGGLTISHGFISKLDMNGNFIWVKQFIGDDECVPESIVLDAAGNIYTSGKFRRTFDFDPGAGVSNLSQTPIVLIGWAFFVTKLDAAGNFIWARKTGSSTNATFPKAVVDATGNVYTSADFQGTTDADPGAAVLNFTAVGQQDFFISKLNSAGNLLWAKAIGGTSALNVVEEMVVDAAGNLVTTGGFFGTTDFDPGAGNFLLSATGSSQDMFILKLDAAGNFVWAKKMGGVGEETGTSIKADAASNIYTTGLFDQVADFDPGPATFNLTSTGSSDIFISKLDATGNFVWAKKYGGTGFDDGESIALDATGNNIFVSGNFEGTINFNACSGVGSLSAVGQLDAFVLKINQLNAGAPTVTVNQSATQADPTAVSPINFTVVFSEPVTGFTASDVQLSGTASATTATVTGSCGAYNVAVSGMSSSGTVIASVPAGAVFGNGNIPNVASTSIDNIVTYTFSGNPAPTVTINQAAAQADPTTTSPINFTVVFSQTVTGFATGDITLTGTAGATIATVTGSGTTYNVAVSGMAANGTVIATIAAGVAVNASSVGNLTSTSTDNMVTYTGIADPPPTVIINQAAAQADPTATSPINFTVVFNETVTGFATGDVTLSGTAGATTATVTGSGTTYNVAVSGMVANGTIIATIVAGVCVDAGNNPNAASTSTDSTVAYTGITNPTVFNVNIFPIPSNGNLKVTANTTMAGATVTVYNSLGHRVANFTIAGGLNIYNVNWQSGVYFLKFVKGDINLTRKIVIAR